MPEPILPRSVLDQELPDALPEGGDDVEVISFEQGGEVGLGEAHPQNRRVAEQVSIARGEPIDLGRHQSFHGVGEVVDAAGQPGGRQQLLQKQRVASGPAGHHRDLVGPKRRVLGGKLQEGPTIFLGERPGRAKRSRVRSGATKPDVLVSARDAHEPRTGAGGLDQVQEQVAGEFVHPVDVLDREHDGLGKDPRQTGRRPRSRSGSRNCSSSCLDFGRGGRSRSNGMAKQGEPQGADPGLSSTRARSRSAMLRIGRALGRCPRSS